MAGEKQEAKRSGEGGSAPEGAVPGRRPASRQGMGLQRPRHPPRVSVQEYECLEQENAVLRREIGKLTEELKHLSEALKEHEKMWPLLLCPVHFVPVPRPDPVAGCLPR